MKSKFYLSFKNILKIPLVFIFLFYSSSILSFDVDPVGKNVKEGVERYKAQNFQGSLDSFNQAESQGKEDDKLYFNKGTSYFKLNDYKLALKYFEKSATSDDKDLKLRSLYNKGNTYAKLGDKKNAIKAYMDALNTNPDFLPARKNLEMLTRKDNKDKQDQKQDNKDQNSENEEEKKENSPDKKNSPSKNKKDSQANKKQEPQENGEEKMKESNKPITKEEAERILESAKQNKINRKKMSQRPQERNEVFW
jgi:Ca-activated chloride channel family protein